MNIAQGEDSATGRLAVWVALAVVIAGIVFAAAYWQDPLGTSPVLDGRENVAWAQRIAAGEVPEEPFYRALLYPYVLSKALAFGIPPHRFAIVFGLLCHFANALLVARLAVLLWRDRRAALLSGAVYGLYPVAQYFAVQVLDITFAITLFLGALNLVIAGTGVATRRMALGLTAAGGLLAGLAVLARPNFLPAALALPLLPVLGACWRPDLATREGLLRGLPIALTVLAALGVQGAVNYAHSGRFAILPWQGAYNLYAANKPGANGKYFTQTVSFAEIPAGMNSTRMESEALYQQATGARAPFEIAAMSAHWRAELADAIASDPLGWLSLMGRKTIYLVNNWEQYNNLTYAYHKQRFVPLALNPLGWSVLLIAAAAALCLCWRRLHHAAFAPLLLAACAYAAGVLLFFVSARFRLPLAPMLAALAGGLACLSLTDWRVLASGRKWGLAAIVVVLAVLSLGDWANARDAETFAQDAYLLASAAALSGEDSKAVTYSEEVLLHDPDRQDALRINLVARYNRLLVTPEQVSPPAEWFTIGAKLDWLHDYDAPTLLIRGLHQWRTGDSDTAIQSWQTALARHGERARSSAKALQAAGVMQGFPADDFELQRLRAWMKGVSQ